MTARQEKVREALGVAKSLAARAPYSGYRADYFAAALAEVEEWETRLSKLSLNNSVLFDQWKAAEAEADRLKAALTVWSEAMIGGLGRCPNCGSQVRVSSDGLTVNHFTPWTPKVICDGSRRTPTGKLLARADAAEAEADRLKAALTELRKISVESAGVIGADWLNRYLDAALAPADRNTT